MLAYDIIEMKPDFKRLEVNRPGRQQEYFRKVQEIKTSNIPKNEIKLTMWFVTKGKLPIARRSNITSSCHVSGRSDHRKSVCGEVLSVLRTYIDIYMRKKSITLRTTSVAFRQNMNSVEYTKWSSRMVNTSTCHAYAQKSRKQCPWNTYEVGMAYNSDPTRNHLNQKVS